MGEEGGPTYLSYRPPWSIHSHSSRPLPLLSIPLLILIFNDLIPDPDPIPTSVAPYDIHAVLEVLPADQELEPASTGVGVVRWVVFFTALCLIGLTRGEERLRGSVMRREVL